MKKDIKRSLCALLVLILTLTPLSALASPESDEAGTGSGKVIVIVEVEGDAVLEAKNAKSLGAKNFLKTKQAKTLDSSARKIQSDVQSKISAGIDGGSAVLYTYTHVINGFAIETDAGNIEAIRALPGVLNVTVCGEIKPPEDDESADLKLQEDGGENGLRLSAARVNYGGEMMNLDVMHERGYTGKGQVIAIVDSSFDVNHTIFSAPVTGARLKKSDIADVINSGTLSADPVYGHLTANRVYVSEKIPYAFNYVSRTAETYGGDLHGTAVAGVAAGNNGTDLFGNRFVGAAPDAQLLLMSIRNAQGGINIAAGISAVDDAVKLGADIINCSFGMTYGFTDDLKKRVYNAARSAGILIAVAEGNDARGFDYKTPLAENIDYASSGEPNELSSVVAVASADNGAVPYEYYDFLLGDKAIHSTDVNYSVSLFETLGGGTYEYIYAGYGEAGAYEGQDAEGKLVLMYIAGIPDAEKTANAKAHGAIGIIFINYLESVRLNIGQEPLQDLPYAVVSLSDGRMLTDAAEKRLTVMNDKNVGIEEHKPYAISWYSSWDTGRELEIKPEITAPGGNVYTSVPDDTYATESGTSISSPFLAGAVALLMDHFAEHPSKYANKGNRASLAENLLMSTASVMMQDNERGIPYSPRLQGAGLADVKAAADTPVMLLGDTYTLNGETLSKSKISLREITLDNNGAFTFSFTARNLTDTPVTYDRLSTLLITDSADGNGYVGNMKKLSFTAELPGSVTVPASGDAEITVSITPDATELSENGEVFVNGFFLDGYVFLENTAGDIPDLNIPFVGFYGDWSVAPIYDASIFEDNLLGGNALLSDTYLNPGLTPGDKMDIRLGQNLFAAGADSEEYAGISPNNDGEADYLQARVQALRDFGETDFAICDTDGNELIRRSDINAEGIPYYASKSNSTYLRFPEEAYDDLADGDYLFKVYAGYRWTEPYKKDQTLTMPFYIDREAPRIEAFSVSDGGELTLSCSDNRHLMGVIINGTVGGAEAYDVYPVAATRSFEETIDVSAFDRGSVTVRVVDYAYNITKLSEIPLNITFDGQRNNIFLFDVENNSGNEISCDLILAAYRAGKLLGTNILTETLSTGLQTLGFNLKCGIYDELKVFALDSLGNLRPLTKAFDFME